MADNVPYGIGSVNRQSIGTTFGGQTGGQNRSLSDLLNDRNIQQFLAQLGAQLDPEGVGGQVGAPTSQLIQRQAMAEALSRGANVKLGADGSANLTWPTQPTNTQSALSREGEGGEGAITGEAGGTGGATRTGEGGGFNMPDLDSILDSIIGGTE